MMINRESTVKSDVLAPAAKVRALTLDLLDGDEVKVAVKTMGISELAGLYSISRKTFMQSWIRPFINELLARGYRLNDRKFNPSCVRLIYEMLGQP